MQELIAILSNLKTAYCSPNYTLHQRHIVLIAFLGVAGYIGFFVFRGITLGYWGELATRTLAVFLLSTLLSLPRTKVWSRAHQWQFELTWLLVLPVFFAVNLFIHALDLYWSVALFLGAAMYGLLAQPLTALILYPVSFFIPLFLMKEIDAVAPHLIETGIQLFSLAYFVVFAMGLLQVVLINSYIKLEEKNRVIEEDKKELEVRKAAAEKASRAKTEFLANMSHEIRTPLNAIVGFSQVLMQHANRHDFPQETRRYLEFIKLSGGHLSEVISNILDLSKIESGKMTRSTESIHLGKLIEGIYQIHQPAAQMKGLEFDFQVDPRLPRYIVTDRTKFNQILMNLVANAIKFTEQGRILLQAERKENRLCLLVEDEGVGIGEDHLELVFEAFEQEDLSTSRKFGGTGLGLSISRRMAELLGGSIWVESSKGSGSRFYLDLPLEEGQDLVEPDGYDYSVAQFAPDSVILVVEDNELNREVIKALLTELNLSAHFARNGEEGITKILDLQRRGDLPELVLMDLHMPVMGGSEAIRRIRSIPLISEIPVVALSADAFSERQEEAIREGFNDYLTKPLQFNALKKVLNTYLRSSRELLIRNRVMELEGDNLFDKSVTEILAPEVRAHVLRLFLKQIPESLLELKKSIENNDADRLIRIAHYLKGSAASIGADEIAKICRELEERGKNVQLKGVIGDYDNLKSSCDRTVEVIRVSHRVLMK